ncbi:hypothetical protein JB92DRAFT_2951855 [Gautieria morchelliformis]|nr:hypothetical protein JB92DRAFT_2951855 [Gautieria morchelliformis]
MESQHVEGEISPNERAVRVNWGQCNLRLNSTRYALNYKGVPYNTVWLEYPKIEPTMRGIGAAPTGKKPDGSPLYTLPVIVEPSCPAPSGGPTVVSESFLIAEYLNETYPTPSTGALFPPGTKALQQLFSDHFFKNVVMVTLPMGVPEMFKHLNEGSRPYWRLTREPILGGKLEEVCPKGSEKWNGVWDELEKAFGVLAALLDKNGKEGNTLVMGTHPTFSDFVIAAFLEPHFHLCPEEWQRMRTWNGGKWERLRDQCAKWRSVN